MAKSRKPPWKKPPPRKAKRSKGLGVARKNAAKRRAKRAGRPYPNLVDNMREAAASRKKRRRSAKPRKKR
jgi:hypothetical protein